MSWKGRGPAEDKLARLAGTPFVSAGLLFDRVAILWWLSRCRASCTTPRDNWLLPTTTCYRLLRRITNNFLSEKKGRNAVISSHGLLLDLNEKHVQANDITHSGALESAISEYATEFVLEKEGRRIFPI